MSLCAAWEEDNRTYRELKKTKQTNITSTSSAFFQGEKKLFILIKRCCKWTIMNDKIVKDSTFYSKDIITSDRIACESFSVIRLQCTSDLVLNTINSWMIIPTLKSKNRGMCFSKEAVNSKWTSSEQHDHLAVGINYRSEQLPGASTAVHTQHAQDLQESQTPDGRGGKNIALRSSCQHRDWGNQHHDVWRKSETRSYTVIQH